MKITTNRKAYFEYSVLEDFNAGIMLLGAEVKSIRNGDVNITDCAGISTPTANVSVAIKSLIYFFSNKYSTISLNI